MVQLEEFVNRILEDGMISVPSETGMEYGVRKGWLEVQDVAEKSRGLNRKQAARIIHNFLRLEKQEPDEIDASPAYVLKDLFDCRVCAGHIIQVYVKGIMDAVEDNNGNILFMAERPISAEEENSILERTFYPEKRRKVMTKQQETAKEPKQISIEEVHLSRREKNAVVVDVRTERAFETGHFEGAVNIPFLNVLKNPYAVSEDRNKQIICYCEAGAQAAAAARCLLEAGYRNVVFFVYKTQ